jgi:hypothetical protein
MDLEYAKETGNVVIGEYHVDEGADANTITAQNELTVPRWISGD